MDGQLDHRLREILEAAEAAAGVEVDWLPIRNEIEATEERLSEQIDENYDRLARRLESHQEAISDLRERVDAIAGTVETILAEIPPG